ncbi:MAG: DsbE family thiol:disulfide interchange protein [Candidatus Puniceispirillaceae bacterium]
MKMPLLKMRFLIPVAAFLLFALIAGAALLGTINGNRNSANLPSVLIGKPAPDLPITPLSDKMARPLSDFAGQPVLVNVMASWCAPCRAEIPALALLSKEIPVIAIAYKDKQQDTEKFLSQYGNPFSAVWMDYDGTAGIKWGVYGVPETFLLDKDGHIVLRHAGPVFKDVITDIIRPALQDLK